MNFGGKKKTAGGKEGEREREKAKRKRAQKERKKRSRSLHINKIRTKCFYFMNMVQIKCSWTRILGIQMNSNEYKMNSWFLYSWNK